MLQQVRESKLAELHAREAAAADARHSYDETHRASVVGGDTAQPAAPAATGAGGAPQA